MLDMGGVAQAAADTRINVGKNNKVRAVALDFHLITRSIEERRRQALAEEDNANGGARMQSQKLTSLGSSSAPIQPDVSIVEKMASLLNVNLGDASPQTKLAKEDDLSAILGSGSSNPKETESIGTKKKLSTVASPHMDIRSKYAAKLRKKIDGGVAGIELAKSEKEDTLKRGDASIHLAARNLISSEGIAGTNTSSTRWLATTGVGKLLSFLSGRSMQIALLPLPSTPSRPQKDEDVKQTAQEMETLTKQLPHVEFNLLLPDGRPKTERSNESGAEDVIRNVLSKIDVPPLKFVVVSDRDDYLKAARDNGMFTCRIRPKNKRRGNLTTNYNVEDVGSVQDVINDINGISFNSALKG